MKARGWPQNSSWLVVRLFLKRQILLDLIFITLFAGVLFLLFWVFFFFFLLYYAVCRNLSSLTGDLTCAPCGGSRVLTTGPLGKSHNGYSSSLIYAASWLHENKKERENHLKQTHGLEYTAVLQPEPLGLIESNLPHLDELGKMF